MPPSPPAGPPAASAAPASGAALTGLPSVPAVGVSGVASGDRSVTRASTDAVTARTKRSGWLAADQLPSDREGIVCSATAHRR